MPIICPCCGSALAAERAPIESLSAAPLTGRQRVVVDTLAHSYPREVSAEYLIDALFGDDANGGPDDPVGVIRAQMAVLRKKLKTHGWTIPRSKGGQGNTARYKLAPMAAKAAASLSAEDAA